MVSKDAPDAVQAGKAYHPNSRLRPAACVSRHEAGAPPVPSGSSPIFALAERVYEREICPLVAGFRRFDAYVKYRQVRLGAGPPPTSGAGTRDAPSRGRSGAISHEPRRNWGFKMPAKSTKRRVIEFLSLCRRFPNEEVLNQGTCSLPVGSAMRCHSVGSEMLATSAVNGLRYLHLA